MELEKNIKEELFCLKFEMEAMSQLLIYSNAERWIYKKMLPVGEEQHLNRYRFAKKFTEDKLVLDIAGGCGYGTFFLATEGNPKEVHSLDLSDESVRYARYRYPHQKITRFIGDAEVYRKENFYDIIVSFETVEHLKKYEQFIENLYSSLKPNGTLIISTPITNKTTQNNINPYHVIEWDFLDFQKLLKKHFTIEEVYVQNILLKKDIINSFGKRVINKFFPNRYKKDNDTTVIKYTNQYDPKEMVFGFQILVCKKTV